MILIYGVEGQPYLIELPVGELTSETVVDDFKVRLCNLGCLLNPHIGQLAFLKRDGLQLFTLFFVIHATENNPVAVCFACNLQRALTDFPVLVSPVAEHSVNCACQLSVGAVPVCDIGFSDAHKIAPLVT